MFYIYNDHQVSPFGLFFLLVPQCWDITSSKGFDGWWLRYNRSVFGIVTGSLAVIPNRCHAFSSSSAFFLSCLCCQTLGKSRAEPSETGDPGPICLDSMPPCSLDVRGPQQHIRFGGTHLFSRAAAWIYLLFVITKHERVCLVLSKIRASGHVQSVTLHKEERFPFSSKCFTQNH